MRLIVIFALAVAMAGCSLFPKKGVDTLIIPGERIGFIRIGMSIDEARELVEDYGPISESITQGGFFNTEDGVGLAVFWKITNFEIAAQGVSQGVVRFVLTDDKRFRTADGLIGPGLPAEPAMADLSSRYGEPTFNDDLGIPGFVYREWRSAGIGLSIEIQTGTIYSVSVYAPTK